MYILHKMGMPMLVKVYADRFRHNFVLNTHCFIDGPDSGILATVTVVAFDFCRISLFLYQRFDKVGLLV